MNKFYFLFIAMFVILLSSCYRSQFSATTRDYKNGKVRYANHYYAEKNKISKGEFHNHQLKEPASSKRIFIPTREDVQSPPEVEITKINPSPISGNDHLIASASNEPTLIAAGNNLLFDETHFTTFQNFDQSLDNQIRINPSVSRQK